MNAKKHKEKLADALQELSDASICYGAIKHPDYTDARKDVRLAKSKERLEAAVESYHETVIAMSFLSRNGKDKTVRY